MQKVMAERNEHLPADRLMQFRMGIHMGDVMADEDEVFGDDVNIAVRLESVAAPGGIAVSGKACQEAGKRLSTGSRTSTNRSRSGPGNRPVRTPASRRQGPRKKYRPPTFRLNIGRRSSACCRRCVRSPIA